MRAVSLFDSIVTSIREARLTRSEALEVVQELKTAYPDVFEQAGIDTEGSVDFRERLTGRDLDELRFPDAEAAPDGEDDGLD